MESGPENGERTQLKTSAPQRTFLHPFPPHPPNFIVMRSRFVFFCRLYGNPVAGAKRWSPTNPRRYRHQGESRSSLWLPVKRDKEGQRTSSAALLTTLTLLFFVSDL